MNRAHDIPNKLVNEKSPYLLQHAYNPVFWYPWSQEAFDKAKEEHKPIFLSIGYSTCHWCHVMERESFEDDEVAQLLNEHFIAIKVDREERPDIDHIYMNVCQTLTGSGGWPLSVFMDADKRPFFAGTYFPKEDKWGMQGLVSLLENVRKAWNNNSDYFKRSSEKIISIISKEEEVLNKEVTIDVIEAAFSQFQADIDYTYGGFGDSPKFPTPHNLYFLLRYWYNTKEESALWMVEKTLESMYKGGIFDHIGFGFSRYSTDDRWLVPHFEKMLYDNALLAIAYLETYQITNNTKYSQVAEQIFTYVLRDMTSLEGGFYSAEDADSEGVEGKFYLWSRDEVRDILGGPDGDKFCTIFDITSEGNFEGKNIPNMIGTDYESWNDKFINECRDKLFQERKKRVHPHKDDKILTSWNGLMIAALSIGGKLLNNETYITAAENAYSFIRTNLIREDGRLLARYRDGEAAFNGYVDDYAFLIWGLIELYEATFKPEYLKKAMELNKDLIKYFWDTKNGGLFVYGSDSEQLITRPKEIYDGATPSGNSVSALNLFRLARLTGDFELEEYANHILKTFGHSIANYPKAYSYALIAMLFAKSGSKEVVIVADKMTEEANKMIDLVQEDFHPFTISLVYSGETETIKDLAPFVSKYQTVNGKPTAYICENFSCQAPVTDTNVLRDTFR